MSDIPIFTVNRALGLPRSGIDPGYSRGPSATALADAATGRHTVPVGSSSPGSASNAGAILSIFGMLNTAIGTFFDLSGQRMALRSQQLSEEHRQSIALLNAQAAELEAQSIEEAGQRERARFGLERAARKGALTARQAASGVVLGTGSAAEVQTGLDLVEEISGYNIEANIVRAREAARIRGTDLRNQAALAGASAANIGATRRSISPYLGAATDALPAVGLATSLISDSGQLSSEWLYAQRRRRF